MNRAPKFFDVLHHTYYPSQDSTQRCKSTHSKSTIEFQVGRATTPIAGKNELVFRVGRLSHCLKSL